jgi:short-subunit dehydrogenase
MSKNSKWILVTGASTGIGRKIAEKLAKEGYNVYAGARKKQDITSLNEIPNVTGIRLDVTQDLDIQNLIPQLKKTGLFALVNNAGIALGGPLMDLEMKVLKDQFEVNFFGVHRITKAVFPYILEQKGRIIIMGSGAGTFAAPFFGPYSSSKYAIEGYSDSLRRELILYDIKVVLIKPGRVRTSIWDKGEDLLQLYEGSSFNKVARGLGAEAISDGRTDSLPPSRIADLVFKALTKRNPKTRYKIATKKQIWNIRFREILPDKIIDGIVEKKMKKFQH